MHRRRGCRHGKDLGGAPGRYYSLGRNDGSTSARARSPRGQKADVAVSDVFYESCASFRSRGRQTWSTFLDRCRRRSSSCPPRAAPRAYLTYAEARASTAAASPPRARSPVSPTRRVFCRGPEVGQQMSSPRASAVAATWSANLRRRWRRRPVIGALQTLHQPGVGFVVADDRDYAQRRPRRPRVPVARTGPGVLARHRAAVSRIAGTCATGTTPSGATSI